MEQFMEEFEENEVKVLTNSPDDDPSKMKRWGFITAKPSEYLIVYRRGMLRESVSGQGARAFVWPWDTVAIVPTTLKEVVFLANQITSDNVEVRLRGAVLYRIRDPMAIHKLINFSYRQRGELKLAHLIADMCRSTTKWLVANMTVEQCLRRRKEEIATSLKREISSIVSMGEENGWGVEIVTIDIQDVYIKDDELFSAIQQEFKADKSRQAQLSRLEAEREVKLQQLADESSYQKQRHQLELEKAQQEADRELFKLELEKRTLTEKLQLDAFHLEEEGKIKLRKCQLEKERETFTAKAEQELAALQAETERIVNERQAASTRNLLEAQNSAGPQALNFKLYSEILPGLAEALTKSVEGARFHIFQGGTQGGHAGPLNYVLAQLTSLMGEKADSLLKPTAGDSN